LELAKIHSLPPKRFLKKIKVNKKQLDPSGLLKNSSHQKEVFSIFKKIRKEFKKINKKDFVVSHGDFHLENIILSKKENIYLIDFSDSGLYPFTYDLGFFLKQFKHMSFSLLSEEEKNHLKEIFIETYFKKTKREITPETIRQINLFKTLVSLKSSVYYNSFDSPNKNEMIKESLSGCQKILKNINQDLWTKKQINI